MVEQKYARAYTEVLEIISHFSEEEYSKIPQEKIDFYKENMDKEYYYKFDPDKNIADQYISQEANNVIITLFRDYYATDKQKETLEKLLVQNEQKSETENENSNNIFKKDVEETPIEDNSAEPVKEELQMVEYKESFFTRLKNFILGLFRRK